MSEFLLLLCKKKYSDMSGMLIWTPYCHVEAQDKVTINTFILVTVMPKHKCPGQDRNRNQCIICNVAKYTCIPVGTLPEASILCLGMIVTKTSV